MTLCTTFGYTAIKKEITQQNKLLLNRQFKSDTYGKNEKCKRLSTATQCLTTFVQISLVFYCCLALATLVFTIEICFGILEPTTVFIIVLLSNSSGWANARGYFYNKKLKARRAAEGTIQKSEYCCNQSTFSEGPSK